MDREAPRLITLLQAMIAENLDAIIARRKDARGFLRDAQTHRSQLAAILRDAVKLMRVSPEIGHAIAKIN